MGKKNKYYPNNYDWIKSMPAEFFDSIPFEEFISGYNKYVLEKTLDKEVVNAED